MDGREIRAASRKQNGEPHYSIQDAKPVGGAKNKTPAPQKAPAKKAKKKK